MFHNSGCADTERNVCSLVEQGSLAVGDKKVKLFRAFKRKSTVGVEKMHVRLFIISSEILFVSGIGY